MYEGDMKMKTLRDAVRSFVAERDWDQFHSPKNLSMALSIEAAELMEHFQWLTEEQSLDPSTNVRAALEDEIGDVLIYLVRLADKLDIDPLDVAVRKLAKNKEKYPVEKARGNARKYSQL